MSEPMSEPTYAGIDPGLSGHLCTMTGAGEILSADPLPTIATGEGARREYDVPALFDLVKLRCAGAALTSLEKQQAMPNQGVSGCFKTGFGYGLLRMALVACGATYEEVRPAKWKKESGITGGGGKTANERTKIAKARAIERCQQLHPDVDLRATPRARTPSGDKAEGILLARYARHRSSGVPV